MSLATATPIESRAAYALAHPEEIGLADLAALVQEAEAASIPPNQYAKLRGLQGIRSLAPGDDASRYLDPFCAREIFRLERAGLIEAQAGGDQDSRLGFWVRA